MQGQLINIFLPRAESRQYRVGYCKNEASCEIIHFTGTSQQDGMEMWQATYADCAESARLPLRRRLVLAYFPPQPLANTRRGLDGFSGGMTDLLAPSLGSSFCRSATQSGRNLSGRNSLWRACTSGWLQWRWDRIRWLVFGRLAGGLRT